MALVLANQENSQNNNKKNARRVERTHLLLVLFDTIWFNPSVLPIVRWKSFVSSIVLERLLSSWLEYSWCCCCCCCCCAGVSLVTLGLVDGFLSFFLSFFSFRFEGQNPTETLPNLSSPPKQRLVTFESRSSYSHVEWIRRLIRRWFLKTSQRIVRIAQTHRRRVEEWRHRLSSRLQMLRTNRCTGCQC